MVARQQHGFDYESSVIKKYSLQKTQNGNKYDAYYINTPVQVKYTKDNNTIYFGSLLNNLNAIEDFLLILGFYPSNREYVLSIKNNIYKDLFDFKYFKEMYKEMDEISNNRIDDVKWKNFINKYKKLWSNECRIFDLSFKRDHKTQKRIQCSITRKNIDRFISCFEIFNIKTNHERDPLKDQYYTDKKTAELVVSRVENLHSYRKIIEPSAGCGSFLDFLPKDTISYDIEPKDERILNQDFLKTDIKPGKILVIGNPPFGRQSSLAKKFIKHSCTFADCIAFILPRSFKKDSMHSCFDTYFHLEYQEDLHLDSFFFEENRYKIPCVFQIWKRGIIQRPPRIIYEENILYYKIVSHEDNPDVSFRRVGINAGLFKTDILDSSKQSHIFIKFLVNFDIEKLNTSLKFDTDNTVGPKSISKNELLRELNRFFTGS